MADQERANVLTKTNRSLIRFLNFFAMLSLALMMFLTFTDVVLRYIFNSPIGGAQEIIEFMMAVFVPISIAYCAQQKQHVSVDLFLGLLSDPVRKILDVVTSFLMMVLFFFTTWESFIYISDEFQAGLTSPVLYIPVYPFITIFAIAFLALSLVLIEQFFETLAKVVS